MLHCWTAAFKLTSLRKKAKQITGACFALEVYIWCFTSQAEKLILLLIHISLSDCCIIRGKEKTHLDKSHSQINHRIANVTLCNSHLIRFFYTVNWYLFLSLKQNRQKHVLTAKTLWYRKQESFLPRTNYNCLSLHDSWSVYDFINPYESLKN